LYDNRSLKDYEGEFKNYRKMTTERVLEVQFNNLINKLDEELDDIIDELKTTREDKREEIRADIQNIFDILSKR
jgi:hypothetical protein